MEDEPLATAEQLAKQACLPSSWELRFRRLEIPSENVWMDLAFDEASFRAWWQRRNTDISTRRTKPWLDVQRLVRRIVDSVLRKVQIVVIGVDNESFFAKHLKRIARICRKILLYHVILCYNLPLREVNILQDLIENTAPVIYLVSRTASKLAMLLSDDTDETPDDRAWCQKLECLVCGLHDKCRILGEKISFDVESFVKQLETSSIFDFDDCPDSSRRVQDASADREAANRKATQTRLTTKSKIELEERATKSKIELEERATNLGKKLSIDAFHHIRKLETRVLEEIGIKQLKHVSYGSRKWEGDGSYADVFEMQRDKDLGPVAVKIYKSSTYAKRVLRESRVWMKVKHPRISELLGFVCFESNLGPQPCLVSKVYPTNLKSVVKDYGNAGEDSKRGALTELRKLEFLRDVVQALEFLHAWGIEHGDLRAENVLVTSGHLDDPRCYAVLNDFGLAGQHCSSISQMDEYFEQINGKRGCWIAPELIMEAIEQGSLPRVSKEGDIYSFGVVFLEVVYEREPYCGSMVRISDAKRTGELPIHKETLNALIQSHRSLMQGCWETPEKRSNIFEVTWGVLDILSLLLPPTPTDLDGPGLSYWSGFLKERI